MSMTFWQSNRHSNVITSLCKTLLPFLCHHSYIGSNSRSFCWWWWCLDETVSCTLNLHVSTSCKISIWIFLKCEASLIIFSVIVIEIQATWATRAYLWALKDITVFSISVNQKWFKFTILSSASTLCSNVSLLNILHGKCFFCGSTFTNLINVGSVFVFGISQCSFSIWTSSAIAITTSPNEVFWISCCVEVLSHRFLALFQSNVITMWITRILAHLVLFLQDRWGSTFSVSVGCDQSSVLLFNSNLKDNWWLGEL